MAGDENLSELYKGEAQLRARMPLLRRRPLLPTPEIVLLLDSHARIAKVSAAYAGDRLAGIDFAIGSTVHEALHPNCSDDACDFQGACDTAWSAHSSGVPVEWLYLSKDTEGALKLRLQPVGYACGVLFGDSVQDYGEYSVMFVQDLAAPTRKSKNDAAADTVRLENAVLYQQRRVDDQDPDLVATLDQRLRAITGRLLLAQEKERRRIASELHDGLGQTLSVLRFEIEGLKSQLKSEDVASAAVSRAYDHTVRALEELRGVSNGLHHEVVGDQGLLTSLDVLCSDFRAVRPEIDLRLDFSAVKRDIPKDLSIAVYRMTQEALNNIAQHSDASSASVSLSADKEGVRLEIRDNGKGLPPEGVERIGLGLITMRERAERLGGKYETCCPTNQGCTIRASWPLDELGSIS